MPHRELEGRTTPHAVAEDVGPFDVEVPQQGGDIVGHLLVGERTVDVGGVTVPLQLDGDDLAGLGQGGTSAPIAPIVMKAPCSTTSGDPVPWVS